MKAKTKTKSTQSGGSSGEKMPEKKVTLVKETEKDSKEMMGDYLKTIADTLFGGKELDGNIKRSCQAIYQQELKNSRRKNPVVSQDGKISDPSKFKRLVTRYTKLLNTVDKTDHPTDVSVGSSNGSSSNGSLMSVQVPVDHTKYIELNIPHYVEVHSEFKVFDAHMKSGIPLLIQGPKGIGKTLGLAKYAEKKRCPIIEYDCSEGTKKYDLQGTKTGVAGGVTPFELGFIPRIIECANQFGMAILVLEELNALTPAMQKLLNPLLDWRKGMYIPEIGKRFKLNDGVKLGIFATTNPASYQASNDLNEDLQSRFSIWKWTYPNVRQEKKAIQWRGVDTSIQKGIMLLAKNTRDFVEKQQLSYALSTRDIQKFIDTYVSYEEDTIEILRLCLDMNVISFYDEVGEISTVKSRIESAFGSNVFSAKSNEELNEVLDEDL